MERIVEMINVSIIGSCQSRDIFNSKFIENYKDYFSVDSYYSMTSMLSIMSEPITFAYHKLIKAGFKECLLEHWFQEFEKPALKTLESKQPDVLLLDFYGDARYGAISYGGEYVINRVDKLKDKVIVDWNNFGIVYSYEHNTEDFVVMWKNAFDRFMAFMKEKLPNTTIIVNTVKGTKVVTDDKGNMYLSPNISNLDIDSINSLWERFDRYAIKKYKLKAITYDKEYTLDPNYPFAGLGWALVHYHLDYYKDCFDGLVKLTSDIASSTPKNVDTNLVTDSAFTNKLRNWTNMAGKYEMVYYSDYQSIRVKDLRDELGEYRPQVWSRPIEIRGDGKTEYTLSFYIKIPDIAELDEKEVIFAIRTFKYVSEVKSAEAIDEYPLRVSGHEIVNNEEYRYIFTFKPKGKYLKLAPFLFRYIPGIEYSRIKLERSSNVSNYTI